MKNEKRYSVWSSRIETIRLIRENREKDKQVERLTNFIIWSIYGTIIAAAVFLRVAGIM